MAGVSGWKTRLVDDTDVPTPAAGKVHLFFDLADGEPKYKDETGAVNTFPSLSSFNGRSGAVVPIQADYDSFFLTAVEGAALITAHEAAGDPHAQYLTAAEGNAAYQPLDADLTSIAALTTTAYGRSLLTLAAAANLAAEVDSFFLTPAEGNAAYQPLDTTLSALAAANWAANAFPIGSGADALAQIAFAANTFPGRSSSGNLVAKTMSDAGFAFSAAADTAAETALLNPATAVLKGLMSASDFRRVRWQYDAVEDFGFVGDLRFVEDGACSSGANTKITSATMAFVAGDLGKRITLSEAGPLTGSVAGQYVGTITNVDSGTQVTVSPVITTTCSAKALQVGTDNTTAIGNMMTLVNTTNAAFPGVKIVFPQSATNAYGFTVPVVFNKQVTVEGLGSVWNTDNGNYTRAGGTRLAWWGTSSDGGVEFGAFFTVQPGAGAVQAIKNPAFRHLWIDGRNGDQNSALYGIRLAGCHQPILENIFFMDCRAAGLLCNSTAVTLSPAGDQGVLRPSFKDLNFRNLETFTGAILTPITTSTVITLTNTGQNITVSASTMPAIDNYAWIATNEGAPALVRYTGGGTTTLNVKVSAEDALYGYLTVSSGNVVSAAPNNGTSMLLGGNLTSNTNCGLAQMIQCTHGANWGPACVEFRNCDSMDFIDLYVNGGSPTNDGAINRIRKEGIRVCGSNVNVALACRNSTFRSGDPSSSSAAGISNMALLNTGAKLAFPAGPTYWDLQQLGNGARIPVVERVATSATQGAAGASFEVDAERRDVARS